MKYQKMKPYLFYPLWQKNQTHSEKTALSLETLPKEAVKAIGFKYADEMRCTLNLPSAMDELTKD